MQEKWVQNPDSEQVQKLCLHCFQPVEDDKSDFCCSGCETVYHLLNQTGLSDYYRIRQSLGTISAPQPVTYLQSEYHYLDQNDAVQPQVDKAGHKSLEFYLEGVHCAACVWLIEKLPDYVPGVLNSRLNLSSSTATVTLSADAKFEDVAQTLLKWGYRPHVIQQSSEAEAHAKREQFMMLSRIGVAAFSAGNLMILAVALYAGLQGGLARYFEWFSLALAAPALTFSAWPFYQQAWSQLVHSRKINVDVPIALSLILGTVGSIREVFAASGHIYFDSLAMLVFLLLFSRYTLWRTQQHILKQDQLLSFYNTDTVERLQNPGSGQGSENWQQIPVSLLQSGDTIRLSGQQRIPVDGVVLEGQSMVDQSVLSGEPFPQPVEAGSQLYCGTRNQQNSLILRVTASGTETRLGQILKRSRVNLEEKTRLVRLADRLARYFVSFVLALAGVLFVSLISHPQVALTRVLALVIVACPCALALATPLIVQMGLKRALAKGFFVRDAESLERLPMLNTVVFDKTGTLTEGQFTILDAQGFDQDETRRAVLALESKSQHPIAHALVQELLRDGLQSLSEVQHFQILNSGGIAGQVQGQRWEIRPDPGFDAGVASENHAGNAMIRLFVLKNGQRMAELVLGDRLRPEAKTAVAALQAAGKTVWLLSGDQPSACAHIAVQCGIAPEQVRSRQTPEDKEAFLSVHPDAMMIGDGINDIMALSKARVGISVQGSAEENLQSSDIYLAEQGIAHLPNLIWHAVTMRRLMYFALGFSLIYNVLGISAALLGWISPLVAAILMPLSALTVFSIAIGGGKLLCKS